MNEQSVGGASDYDFIARQNGWYPEVLFGLCYEYIQPGDRLLDVGTGTGLAAEPFAKAGVQVFGLDNSPELLDVFRSKGIAVDIKEHDLSITPWPYTDDMFDHILASGVLHFLADLEPIFREVSRLLRPNGVFTFTTKAPASEPSSAYLTETIQGTTLYLHSRATLKRHLEIPKLTLRKEMSFLVRSGRYTDDVFPAFVTQRSAS